MIFKFNRLLSKKEKNMIMDAYKAGFEEGYRAGSKETTDFAKRYCEAIAKGEPLAEKTEIETMWDNIRIYGKIVEDGKRFLEEMEENNGRR